MIMLSKFSFKFQNFLFLKWAQMNLELNAIVLYNILSWNRRYKLSISRINFQQKIAKFKSKKKCLGNSGCKLNALFFQNLHGGIAFRKTLNVDSRKKCEKYPREKQYQEQINFFSLWSYRLSKMLSYFNLKII